MFTVRLVLAAILSSTMVLAGKQNKVMFSTFSRNTPVYVKPQWISVTQLVTERNVTVQYKATRNVQVTWYINGYIASASDDRFSPIHTKKSVSSFSKAPKTVRQASIKIPNDLEITDLRVTLTLKVFEVELQIHLPRLNESRTVLEMVPGWSLYLEPHELVRYKGGADVVVSAVLMSEILNDAVFLGTNFSFVGFDTCTTPLVSSVKTPESDPDFMRAWVPRKDDPALNRESRLHVDRPTYRHHVLKLLRPEDRFKGILKVSTGFSPSEGCLLFGGIKLTRYAFFAPIRSSKFLGKDSVAFLGSEQSYTTKIGGDIDIKISALGGYYEGWYNREHQSHPQINVYQKGEPLSGVERVDTKRLFQREVALLFRNVTVDTAGRYVSFAELGDVKVKRYFTLFVKDNC